MDDSPYETAICAWCGEPLAGERVDYFGEWLHSGCRDEQAAWEEKNWNLDNHN